MEVLNPICNPEGLSTKKRRSKLLYVAGIHESLKVPEQHTDM